MRRTALAVVLLPVLALTACTQAAPTPAPSASTTAPAPSPTPTTAALSVVDVAAIAIRAAGGGSATSVEQEADGTSWRVLVVAEDGSAQEVHVRADGTVGAGPSDDPQSDDARSANRALVAASAVSLGVARRRMLAAVPDGTVTGIALGEYADRVVWQGDVVVDGVRHDVRIDAVNGSVLLERADSTGGSAGGS